MTTISGANTGSSNILTTQILSGLSHGDVTSHSSTKYVVNTSPGPLVTFSGTGFTYSSQGVPTGGHVTGVVIQDSGATAETWSGFNVSAPTLWSDVKTLNLSAFNTLLFSGNDTFTSHATHSSNPNNLHDNHFEGFAGNDTFNLQTSEGDDTLLGDAGNDTFNFGGAFTAKEHIDGGTGTDVVNLDGNYASGVTFSATTMKNVEKIALSDGFSYKLTTNDATVASGQTLTVDGSALKGSHTLSFNGSAETNGKFVLDGGTGNDMLKGGHGNDMIDGGAGADMLTGGAGSDVFVYKAVADSPGTATGGSAGHGYDTITDFNASSDKIEVWHALSGVNSAVNGGSLSTTTFDADLATILNGTPGLPASNLGAYHAVVVTPSSGTLAHDVFLVVDTNGTAGYQAGHDLVIDITGATNLSHIAVSGDFVT